MSQLVIVPQLVVQFSDSSFHARILSGLNSHRACAYYRSHCELIYVIVIPAVSGSSVSL